MMFWGVWIAVSICRLKTKPTAISTRHSTPLVISVVETVVRTPA